MEEVDTTATETSRKRKATSPSSQIYHDEDGVNEEDTKNDYLGVFSTCESLLSVPLEIVFRQIPSGTSAAAVAAASSNNGKPLLSRAEAKCMIQIGMLAQEIDALQEASHDALKQRLWCRSFGQKLLHPPATSNASSGDTSARSVASQQNQQGCCHPFLRPLLPLLAVQGDILTTNAIYSIEAALHRVLVELQQCRQSLQQFSEQNWTLAESLLDALGDDFDVDRLMDVDKDSQNSRHNNAARMEEETKDSRNLPKGAILAREKRRLSDLEEELCNRIDMLLAQRDGTTPDTAQSQEEGGREESGSTSQDKHSFLDPADSANNDNHSDFSMSDLCARLWNTTFQHNYKNDNDEDGPEEQQDLAEAEGLAATGQRVQPSSDTLKAQKEKTNGQMEKDDDIEQQQKLTDQEKTGLFSYPETVEGLDQQMMLENQQQPLSSTPMTNDVLEGHSKPPESSMPDDYEEEEDDDDETVGDEDAFMADAQATQAAPEKAMAFSSRKEASQQSAHSVVSDDDDRQLQERQQRKLQQQEEKQEEMQQKQKFSKYPKVPTQSQFENAEALAMLAFGGGDGPPSTV